MSAIGAIADLGDVRRHLDPLAAIEAAKQQGVA
jgi:hypothetical protein